MRDGARSITPRELEIATNSVCEADKDWVCPPQGPGYRCDGREISGIEYPLLLGTDSMVEDCARLCENLLQCDGFEYIGPGHSDHGKCWLKQTVSYVRQSRGSRNEHRYSSKCRIAPKQLPVFRHNLGFCRGGPAWSSSSDLWNCLEHSLTVDGCKAACNDDSNCGAFDIPPGGGSGNNGCCLFRAGNTGNGGQGRNCYVQQPLATRVGNGWCTDAEDHYYPLGHASGTFSEPIACEKICLGKKELSPALRGYIWRTDVCYCVVDNVDILTAANFPENIIESWNTGKGPISGFGGSTDVQCFKFDSP